MPKAYIAAPIFNPHQLGVVEKIKHVLTDAGYENIFSPYHASRAIWAGRAPKDCSEEERQQVLRQNVENLHDTTLLVAWVGGREDGETDPGVVWEMGYFQALPGPFGTKSTIHERATLAYVNETDVVPERRQGRQGPEQHMNLMLAGTIDAMAIGRQELFYAAGAARTRGHKVMAEQYDPTNRITHEGDPIA